MRGIRDTPASRVALSLTRVIRLPRLPLKTLAGPPPNGSSGDLLRANTLLSPRLLSTTCNTSLPAVNALKPLLVAFVHRQLCRLARWRCNKTGAA